MEVVTVALVEPKDDLGGRDRRDDDDDGVEPVPPPEVPRDLDHGLKVAQARAKRIGRGDDAGIVLEEDFESDVRPTIWERRRETITL